MHPPLGPPYFPVSVGLWLSFTLWQMGKYKLVYTTYIFLVLCYLTQDTQDNILKTHPFSCKFHDVIVINN